MIRARTPTPPTAPPRSGLPERLAPAVIDEVLQRAFAEDLGIDGEALSTALASGGGRGGEAHGLTGREASIESALERDLSTGAAVPAARRACAKLVAKAAGVVCGLDVFARAFELLDPDVEVRCTLRDGDTVEPGTVIATVEGHARALLTAERTALNLLQRMSGTATATARLVRAARSGNPQARVLDTRKTTPGLRAFERYAVRAGGGENHRYGLDDEVMLKDNHLDLSTDTSLIDLVRRTRETVGDGVRITVEARDLSEAEAALDGGADVLLLDNFEPEGLAPVCAALRERAAGLSRSVELEASGGIDEHTAGAFAAAGVDRLSVGAPTHSAPALDLSLRLEPVA
ncbi:MAG: carboxylating nicotinate-nucleotide diphosphorylase [Planctomycetota bacterium]